MLWTPLTQMNPDETLFEGFCRSHHKTPEDFVKGDFDHLISPFVFQDMQKAVNILTNAIAEKKRILIFGDYDVDGISGTAQLYLMLKTLNATVSYRLPCRDDGYGLSEKFIYEAHEKNVSVFITTDCGVSNVSEISLAKQLGMQVIITDHHSVPEMLPPADAILHPLVKTEPFPDKHLTGSGVAWYLCRAMFETLLPNNASLLAEELLELAVLGTVADCGRLEGENRNITHLGLKKLESTNNKGLKALMEISGTDPQKLSPESIGFYLAPRINASGRIAHPRIALELLLGNADRAKELNDLNIQRQDMLAIMLEEAEEQASLQRDSSIIMVKSKTWPSGIIGLISGRLAEKYARPVIAWEEAKTKYTGSCRGPIDFHIANTLKSIKNDHPEIFLGCGGHAQAAGLSIYPEYFEVFQNLYQNAVEQVRGKTPPEAMKQYIFEITRKITIEEVAELWQKASPFGIGNELPVFCFSHCRIITAKAVGVEKTHLSLFLSLPFGQDAVSGIFFRAGELVNTFLQNDIVTVYATPEIKHWNGKTSLGLKILDIIKA